jgi:hypothetical protein
MYINFLGVYIIWFKEKSIFNFRTKEELHTLLYDLICVIVLQSIFLIHVHSFVIQTSVTYFARCCDRLAWNLLSES